MISEYMERFADNLRLAINERGVSVNEFSKKVGIPQQTISRYINCQREISFYNLCKIADFLDEDIDALIGRKGR